MATRPVYHPPTDALTVAGVLHALADPARLAIVRALHEAGGSLNCSEVNSRSGLAIPKSTCSQHFQVLRESGLVRCERRGVELMNTLRTAELEARFPGLLSTILASLDR